MLLREFLEKKEAVEIVKKELGSTKTFDLKYQKLVTEIETIICNEKEIDPSELKDLPKNIEFISPKIKRLYGEFNQLLDKVIKNLVEA